ATLLACEWFARIGVDIGVIEVGLGGRLDATNLVRPMVTAITSIALDHEEYLGTDLGSIAAEKAGIAKPGVPLVIGRLPAEAEAAALARDLPSIMGGRRVTLGFAVMADKAWPAMLETLGRHVARAIVTRVGRRGLDPERAAERLAGRLPVEAVAEPDVALRAA